MSSRIRRNRQYPPGFLTWVGMKARCNNPNQRNWQWYGGRGITVCERWLNSFENFLADMGPPPPMHCIERLDVDGNYDPENCTWIPRSEQGKNTRARRFDWAEIKGIDRSRKAKVSATHCLRGHALSDGPNRRRCKICERERIRKRNENWTKSGFWRTEKERARVRESKRKWRTARKATTSLPGSI